MRVRSEHRENTLIRRLPGDTFPLGLEGEGKDAAPVL